MDSCIGRTRYFRAFILVACLAMIGYGLPAVAQEEELTPEQQAAMEQAVQKSFEEEITVTGSLIPRPTLEAMSPVSVLEPEQITYSGVTRLEDVVRQLPQVFSVQNSTISNGSSGTATVDLRSLGAVRTLVLINGRRTAPGDAFAVAADLNFIPAGIVKRVDVLTGGASSVYGADAVTGVVNFIIDKDFSGVKGSLSWGAFNHNNDNAIAQQMNEDAGFPYPTGNTTDGQQLNANIAVGSKFADGKGHASAYIDYRNVDELLKAERDYLACAGGRGPNGPECSGSSTSLEGRFQVFDRDWIRVGDYVLHWAGDGGDGHSFRPRTGDVFNYGPLNHVQRPDTRYAAGGFANYEINEHFDVYTEVMFMDDYTEAQIAYSGAFGVTDFVNCDNPMMSAQQYDLICTQNGYGDDEYANVIINRRSFETGPRTNIMRHTSWRMVAGMRGDISDAWSYDFYGLYAETLSPQEYIGDLNSVNIGDALDVIEDPDTGEWVCRSGNPNCAPWNVFQEGGVSQAAADYIALNQVLVSGAATKMANLTFFGDLESWGWTLPGASEGIQVALGAEYRQESLYVHPDAAFEVGLGAGSGGPTVRVDGNYDVKELFIEALVPIVQDARGFRDLSFELGYRYSDYSTSGTAPTYKVLGTWAPADSFKFRMGYAQATRSPNVRELFRPQGLGLGGSDDPCANDDVTGLPANSLEECLLTGMTAAQYGNVPGNPADQYNTIEGGNPLLDPETATTYTLGVVLTPPSLSGFSIALDYYNIEIEDQISGFDADDVINGCIANGDPGLCDLIHRDIIGTLWLTEDGYTTTTNQNLGKVYGEGIDVNFSWLVGLGDSGFLNTALMGSYMMADRLSNPLIDYDCVGYYGDQCDPYPTPEWRHRATVSWETNFNMVFNLGWRYISSVLVDDASPDPDLANPGLIEEHRINDTYQNPGFNYIDLSWSWNFTKNLQFILGVNNIFDEEPPLAPGWNDNDYGPGFYGTYDPYGRVLHSALHFNF